MQKIINIIRTIYTIFLLGFLVWGITSGYAADEGSKFFISWIILLAIFLGLNLLSKSWRKGVSAQFKKGQSSYAEAQKPGNFSTFIPFSKKWRQAMKDSLK